MNKKRLTPEMMTQTFESIVYETVKSVSDHNRL